MKLSIVYFLALQAILHTELTRQALRVLDMQYVLQQQQEGRRRLIKENERRDKLLREKNIYIIWYDEKGQLGHWRFKTVPQNQ